MGVLRLEARKYEAVRAVKLAGWRLERSPMTGGTLVYLWAINRMRMEMGKYAGTVRFRRSNLPSAVILRPNKDYSAVRYASYYLYLESS